VTRRGEDRVMLACVACACLASGLHVAQAEPPATIALTYVAPWTEVVSEGFCFYRTPVGSPFNFILWTVKDRGTATCEPVLNFPIDQIDEVPEYASLPEGLTLPEAQ